MKLFYIENTVDERNSRIMGYFSTLDAAQDALKSCEDWYRSKGTGKIYQVDMDTLSPEHVVVCKDGVLIDPDVQIQDELYELMKPAFIRFAEKSNDTFLTLANFCTHIIQNEPDLGLMALLYKHDIAFTDDKVLKCFKNVLTEYESVKDRLAPTFNLNALVVDDKDRRGRVVEYEPETNKYHVLFIDPENIGADGWYEASRLTVYETKKQPLSVTDLISRATAISEQSKSLADDLGKVKNGFEMTE